MGLPVRYTLLIALLRYRREPPELNTDCLITQLPLRAAMPSLAASTASESALPLLFSPSNSPRLPDSAPAVHRTCDGGGGGGGGGGAAAMVVRDSGADCGEVLPAASKAATVKA